MTYFRRISKTKGAKNDASGENKKPGSPDTKLSYEADPQDPKKERLHSPHRPTDGNTDHALKKGSQSETSGTPSSTKGSYLEDAQDIIQEIHHLLHATEPDIIDLKRPIDDSIQGSTKNHQTKKILHDLHEDVIAKSTQAIDEFAQAIQGSIERKTFMKQTQDLPLVSDTSLSLDSWAKDAIAQAVDQWMHHHTAWLEKVATQVISQQMPSLLAQWLNTHLPDQLRHAIDRHLQQIAHQAKTSSGRSENL